MPRSKHRNVKRHCRLDIRKLCISLLFPFAFEDEKATTVPAATRYASHVLPLETSIHEVLKRFHDAQLIPRMVIEWRMGKGPVNGVTCNGSIHDGYTCVLVHTRGGWNVKEPIGFDWSARSLALLISSFGPLAYPIVSFLLVNLLSAYTSGRSVASKERKTKGKSIAQDIGITRIDNRGGDSLFWIVEKDLRYLLEWFSLLEEKVRLVEGIQIDA